MLLFIFLFILDLLHRLGFVTMIITHHDYVRVSTKFKNMEGPIYLLK